MGDNDHLLTVYTAKEGKLELIAKGARKITSKFTGHLELLNLLRFEIYQSRKYHLLCDCQLIRNWQGDLNNLEALRYFSFFAELIDKSTQRNEPQQKIYLLLLKTLNLLNTCPKKAPVFQEAFKIKFLHLLGIMPSFKYCQHCRKKFIEKDLYLSHRLLSCPSCFLQNQLFPYQKISLSTAKLINFLQTRGLSSLYTLKNIRIPDLNLVENANICRHFLEEHLNQKILSEKFILNY